MLEVIRAQHALYQHVIDVYVHGSLDQEDFVNHPLERAPTFLSPKGITL